MKYASLRVDQIQLYEKIRLECNEIGIRDRQEKPMNFTKIECTDKLRLRKRERKKNMYRNLLIR